jgi:hypothetical protein
MGSRFARWVLIFLWRGITVSIWVFLLSMSCRWGPRTVASAVGRRRGAIGGFGRHIADVQVIAVLKTISAKQSDIVGPKNDSNASRTRYLFYGSDACPRLPHSHSVIQGRHVYGSVIGYPTL